MDSDSMRVVLIGTGGIGKVHAQLWQEVPNARLVGVYDLSASAAEAVARRLGIQRVYGSLAEALAEPEAVAVDVCTPNRFHAPVVIAALEAGKHCLCEKPLAASTADIRRMIEARDRSGKLLMTAQHMRFEQRSMALNKLIQAGQLGQIYYTRAWWLRRRMAPATPGFLNKEQAGYGPGMDIGVHVLDLSMHLMGFPQPESVTGYAVCKIGRQADVANQWGSFQPEDFEVEDFAAGFIRFKNGAALSLEVSWLLNMHEAEVSRIWLHGTAGGAVWPDGQLSTVSHGLLLDTQLASNLGGDGHKNELIAFSQAVRAGGSSPVPAEQSLDVVRVLEALYESAEKGHEIRM